ncbi:MAG: hypothetical protein KDB53_08825 [Planctomycetes bacterium]|nr:hypothetical protein [Planctomycetota bacterium]
MKSLLPLVLTMLVIHASVHAQQLELNDAGGAMRHRNNDPSPGSPFLVGVSEGLTFAVRGGSNQPFSLIVGNLTANSLQVPILNNQFFDLDLAGAAVVGDGIGGAGALPSAWFVLGPAGSAVFSFPTHPGLDGQRAAFQAVVADPTLAPLNLNLTAAPEFQFTNGVVGSGDENLISFVFPSGSYSLYGQAHTGIEISSNGWITFGTNIAQWPDPFPTVLGFTMGSPGDVPFIGLPILNPRPAIAALWDDLDLSAGTFSAIETLPGITTITWTNGSFVTNGQPFGTISCIVDVSTGSPFVLLDYTAFAPAMPMQSGLVGLSDGASVAAVVHELDLVTGGLVNSMSPMNPANTYLQEFSGAGTVATEALDLSGRILSFFDSSPSGTGAFFLF